MPSLSIIHPEATASEIAFLTPEWESVGRHSPNIVVHKCPRSLDLELGRVFTPYGLRIRPTFYTIRGSVPKTQIISDVQSISK